MQLNTANAIDFLRVHLGSAMILESCFNLETNEHDEIASVDFPRVRQQGGPSTYDKKSLLSFFSTAAVC